MNRGVRGGQAGLAPVVIQSGVGVGNRHLVICSRVGTGLRRGMADWGVACVGGASWRCWGLEKGFLTSRQLITIKTF